MDTSHSLSSERLDTLLSTLANQHCRFVGGYFRDESEEVASVEGITTAFIRENAGESERVAIQFQRTALPKLKEIGIVAYDRCLEGDPLPRPRPTGRLVRLDCGV